ncbi:MAG: hypothetical protein A3H72_03065 [Candidatus Doudnabacteria bacterium RIFCSPLOWO2_02_FULL_48_8]|uniref:Uncharacterized protein n=1 Tax=Candidatus Doudnabacteria bacterium RIFCSPHIGHO2_01_FULL_46_24 TaxID=1817825 RepID=A0A1F5NV91_9BACT|nr:MAG: hypothetical protein A2720_00625 [Candidatus Doudnabacteria bacterium RIFCSPHIGHO2_01_FULL_46_24]OGE95656.1 MAG: hypothetical protein A3H72_03065 [Candidatus Doudnabacteria bacterium RIFCSPLOWO2_02_FULL_48_8]OGE95975.1 MAG: hypothetical protein A3E98_04085 [Candidatus Doudnabacteria bacterium RIFCSPHIGHO2_12_FULL_48_11]
MLTAKKKRVYIGIIIFCIVATIAVFVLYKPSVPTLDLSQFQSQNSTAASGGIRVFPQNKQFDESVFKLSKFKSLTEYQPIELNEEELGRENPFKPQL